MVPGILAENNLCLLCVLCGEKEQRQLTTESTESMEGSECLVVIGSLEKADAAQRPGAQDTAKSNENSPEKNAMGGYRNSPQLTMKQSTMNQPLATLAYLARESLSQRAQSTQRDQSEVRGR